MSGVRGKKLQVRQWGFGFPGGEEHLPEAGFPDGKILGLGKRKTSGESDGRKKKSSKRVCKIGGCGRATVYLKRHEHLTLLF